MYTLPSSIIKLVAPFVPKFDKRTWEKSKELMFGAILSTGKRTVTAALRVLGHSDEENYSKYHQVLN